MRRRKYPLFPAARWRMGIYADVFSAISRKDMRRRFADFGVELDIDPPWGWETCRK